MTRLHTPLAVLLSVLFHINFLFAQPASTFDSDSESWYSVCDGACSAPTIYWSSTSGSSGGGIYGTDVSTGTWYWRTPAEFNTDLSGYYGCSLTFQLKQNTTAWQFNAEDVVIIRASDGARICYATSPNPGTTWTGYSVPLTETGWRYNSLSGANVSSDDMINWLSDVNRIWIRAEYSGLTYETDWIDDVLIDCGAIVLPVELYNFEATEVINNIALLSWTTLSETNCNGFQIEKSVTDGMVYDSIGYIAGNGTTTQTHDYLFSDDNFTTPAYYRLKQTDFDGAITYSPVITLSPSEEGSVTTTVFPNPASEYAYIESSSKTKIFEYAEVRDVFGKVVHQTTEISKSYPIRAAVNVSNLPTGLYTISLVSAQGNETLPLQVIEH